MLVTMYKAWQAQIAYKGRQPRPLYPTFGYGIFVSLFQSLYVDNLIDFLYIIFNVGI